MALILTCTRRITQINDMVKKGGWKSQPDPRIGSEIWPKMTRLKGKTLGLLGFGRIPQTLVPKAMGFGLRIIVYDPYVSKDSLESFEVEQVTLDELLAQSDIVSVHVPLNAETRHMIGMEELKKMKPTACLVNTARGAIVDHEALYTALSEGLVSMAAFDVTEPEPIPSDSPLLKLDNFVVTGHSAHAFSSSSPGLFQRPAEEVIRVARGEWPVGLVNPAVKGKYNLKWSRA
jgi:D-3-phosphoglycerate dehydrogenase